MATSEFESGNDVQEEVWEKLLRRLTLVDALRLEPVCATFARLAYSGQRHFIWSKKFQEYLYGKYRINQTQEMMETFLPVIARKIGPHCHKIILKLVFVPSNYEEIFREFSELRSCYLQLQINTPMFNSFFEHPADSGVLPHKTLTELRLYMKDNDDYLPKETIEPFMQSWAPLLTSVQVWRSEMQCKASLLQMKQLKRARFYVNPQKTPHSLHYFKQFARTHGKSLETLYLEWEQPRIDGSFVKHMGEALGQLVELRRFNLEINWETFRANDRNNFLNEWTRLVREVLPRLNKINRLSVDEKHNNYNVHISESEIVNDLACAIRPKMLRVIASDIGMFPIPIRVDVETLELCCKYTKVFREIWELMGEKESQHLPSNLEFVKECQQHTSLTTLKMVHCPLLSTKVFEHFREQCPHIELLFIRAIVKEVYSQETAIALNEFVKQMPKLRVIRFEDKFKKPDMTCLAQTMIARAQENPDKCYVLYCDKKKYIDETEQLKSIEINNLRIY